MVRAGEFLKTERLKQNKTLKEIAKSTRISVFFLDALEADKTESLPPSAYVKGFIKAYACELDINPDEVLVFYKSQMQEQSKAEQPKEQKSVSRRIHVSGYVAPLIAGAMLLLICAVYFGYRGKSSDDAGLQSSNYAEDIDVRAQLKEVTEPLAPAITSQPDGLIGQAADNSLPDKGSHFTVRFTAAERSWMRFTVDEKHVFEVILKPGETYSVNAVSGIKVRIGNPGGLSAFYNDVPVAVPGRRGTPVEMHFPLAAYGHPEQ
jgi:hypothetical protein